jgi:hypothetical protein
MRNSLRIIAFAALACFALASTPRVFAQGVHYNDVARTADNRPLSNGLVAVCSAQPTSPGNVGEPCAPLAALAPDSSGTVYTITSAVRSAGMVTITTNVPNAIVVAQSVTISGVSDPSFDGTYQVASQLGSTFDYVQTGANSNSSGGTVTGVNPINADVNGNFSFWAAPGTYFLEFYSPSKATAPFTQLVTLACVPNTTTTGCGSAATQGNNTWTGANTFTGATYFGSGDPWFDIRAFGAKCDDVTDDTAAIQATLAALPSTGGVILIPGVCKFTSTLVISTPDVTIEGQGHFQFITQNAPVTYLDYQGTTGNAIDVAAQGFAMANLGVKYPTTIGGPLATPPAPTLTQVADSGCPAEAYYVEATYVSAQGQTNVSSEATFTTTTGNCLKVESPAAESGATGWNVFVSSNSNNETLQNSTPLAIGTNWTFAGTLVNLGFRPATNTTAYAAIYDPNGAQLNGVKIFTDASATVGTASMANGYTSFGCCGKLENVYIAGFGIGVLGAGSDNDFSIKDSYIQADNVGAFIVNGADINIEDDDFEGNGVGNIKMLYGSPYTIKGNYFEQQGTNPPSYNVQVGDTTIPPQGFTPTPGSLVIEGNFMQCNLTAYPPAPIVVDTAASLRIERNSFSQCENQNIINNLAGSAAHIKVLGNISDATPLSWITSTTGVDESDINGTQELPGTPFFYGLGIDSASGNSSLLFRSGGTSAWNMNASTFALSFGFNAHNGENVLQLKPFGSQSFASVQSNYAMGAAEVIVTQSGNSATFDAGLGNTFELIMNANVTSVTLQNLEPGQWLDFIICQGGGGPWTFTWPSNVFGGGTVGTTSGDCSTQAFYVSGTSSSNANAWAAGPMLVNLTSGSAGPQILGVAGTVPYFTGSWTNGNCLEAGGSPGLITVTSSACGSGGGGGGGGGTSVSVDGGAALGSANFGPSPGATTNNLNVTWQFSGSTVSAELPVFGASGASHALGIVPDPGSTSGTTRFLREDGTWAVPPSSGSSSPPDVLGFTPKISGSPARTLTIGSECAISTPCNVRVDNTVYSFTSDATAVIGSSVTASGTVIAFINDSGSIEEVDNLGNGSVTCTDCLSTQQNTPSFPNGSFPIVSVQVVSGVYATLSDWRSGATIASYQAGAGLDAAVSGGITTFSVDSGAFGGGAATYASSQTLNGTNSNELVIMDCSSACTATLPATLPSGNWSVAIQAPAGAATVTVSPNGLEYNGSTSSFTIPPLDTVFITNNGTNYVGDIPIPGPLSAGTCTLSSGSCSHTFTQAYPSAPICTATDTTSVEAVKATSTTTAITVTGTGSDVVAWHCQAANN